MKEIWWKLPILRGLSPLRRGFVETFAVCAFGTLLAFPFLVLVGLRVPAETFDASAQIGATLLVAYAVEISWWLKSSQLRGAKRENWVGFSAGIGTCGLTGVGVAVLLSIGAPDLNWIETLGTTWSLLTIILLGGLVATLPLLIYEWTHRIQAEYPDE
jgi:hypothetical protein